MRRYLVDTGPLAAFLNNRPPAVELISPWILQREAATSALTYAEIIEYVRPRQNYAARQLALRLLLREI